MENKQLNLSEPENIMGTMDVNPLLIKLSIPMMISMLVQALYNVVDSIFVARVSENALTAVSLAFSLQNMMFAVGIGTGVGVNALLSKSLGEKNQYRANKTAENGLFLALCSYLVFLVLGLTVVRPYFYAQTADADIADLDHNVREVGVEEQADEGRDDVADQRVHDGRERRADDHADGHVHDIALERKFLEFLEKCHICCF